MSKDDTPELPRIPSWEELGISAEELKALEEEMAAGEAGDEGAPSAAARPTPGPPEPATPPSAKGGSPKDANAPAEKRPTKTGWFRRKSRKKAEKVASEVAGAAPAGPGDQAASAAPPPPSRYRGPVTILALLVMGWFASWSRIAPAPLPASAPDSLFSAERAIGHIEQIARAGRSPGSPEHARVRQLLIDALTDLGLEPMVQTTTSVTQRGTLARAATVRNIMARIPGSASTGTVLATAHYDGAAFSPAAADDGAGLGSLLEALRAMRSGPPLQNDLVVLFTDAEELGMLGAAAFVDQHPWMEGVRLVLSFEMRGGAGPALMFETGSQSGWVVERFGEMVDRPLANSLFLEVYRRMPNDTDFTPFREAGKQGLNFAAIDRAHVYHESSDVAENLSARTVQHLGEQGLAVMRGFGSEDLTSVTAPDRVYFTVPYWGLVDYPAWGSYVLSGVLLLLTLGLFVLARRSGARSGGLVVGGLVALTLMGASAGLALFLVGWLFPLHAEAGQLSGSLFHSEGPYVAAVAALAVALALALVGAGRRWASLAEISTGAILLPALLAIVAGAVFPLAGMNVQWPMLAGVVAALLVVRVDRGRRPGLLRWLLLLGLAVPVFMFFVPLYEAVAVGMTFSVAPGLAVFATLGLIAILPLMEIAQEPKGWLTTGAALVAGAGLLVLGLSRATPSATRPLPSTLLYTLDRESGEALWLTDPVPEDQAAAERMLPVRAWALERAGAADTVRAFPEWTGRTTLYAAAPARIVDAALPLVILRVDSVTPGLARLEVRSAAGAELLHFDLPDVGMRVDAINGRPVAGNETVTAIDHWGAPEGAVLLDLRLQTGNPILTLAVVEHHLRPWELLGARVFERPAELAPNVRRGSDRALLRTLVTLDLQSGTVTLSEHSDRPETQGAEAEGSGEVGEPALQRVTVIPGSPVSLFGVDRISSPLPEFGLTFAPDGRTAYFNRTDAGRERIQLLASILRDGEWSEAVAPGFAGFARDIDPFVSPDGERIYFSSDRPRADAPAGSFSTWYVERTPAGWSAPLAPGAPLNSDSSEVFVSASIDGTVVFSSDRDGVRRIYESRETEGGWTEPVALVFGTQSEGSNPFIDPQGRFLILSLPGPFGGTDLWASCRAPGGGWGEPVVFSEPVNSPFAEFAPGLHPEDGSLVFTSERPGIVGPVDSAVRPPGDLYRTEPGFSDRLCR